jgi:hypothetical protein
MEAILQEIRVPAAPAPFTSTVARGEWPRPEDDLPLIITQHQFAHLRGVTIRTLQRERQLRRFIPYVQDGKNVYYAKHHVLQRYGGFRAA